MSAVVELYAGQASTVPDTDFISPKFARGYIFGTKFQPSFGVVEVHKL